GPGSGVDPVRADREIDAELGAVRLLYPRFPISLSDVDALVAEQVAFAPEAAQQRAVDGVPVAEAVGLRLLMDDLALAVEVADVFGGDAHLVEVEVRPLDQVAVAGRQEADAGPSLLQLGARSLVNGDVVAKLAQEQCCREASQGAPDDRDARGADHGAPNIGSQ